MKKLSLNMKIVFVLSLFVIGSIAISFIGLSKMDEINQSLNNIVGLSAKRVENAHILKELIFLQIINENRYILEQDAKELESISQRITQRDSDVKALIKEATRISSDKGKEDLATFGTYYSEWFENMENIKSKRLANDMNGAFELSSGKGREIRLKSEELLDTIVKRNVEDMEADAKSSDVVYDNSKRMVLTTSLTVVLCGLALAFFILRALSRTIDQVIENLGSNSMQVTAAAGQIASSSEELSQAASEQASSLEETAASIEEMSSMIQRNAENATRTSTLAQNSSQGAKRGQDVVQNMIEAIAEINSSNTRIMEQVEDSNQQISDIVNVIAEIGNKTKVINDIVFQTKLLSFNASVEAARAGEHGKGFAVVAEEVGSLAQMSGNAAREISDMLEASMQKVESIVNDTKQKVGTIIVESKGKIEHGTGIAKECGLVLDEIVKNISSVNQMASDISTASQEQSQGIQEITRAMGILDQVTQTNAATSEEAASAAEELSSQAESLRGCVDLLIQTIKGEQKEVAREIVRTSQPSKNVVHLKPRDKTPRLETPKIKKAVGQDFVPTEDDPRFEEI